MELPLWMASYLANKEFVACELPKPYQETSRNILLADSSVVDLFKQVIIILSSARLRMLALRSDQHNFITLNKFAI